MMAKNLILYYSRRGENYVNGGVENLAKGNTEIVAEFVQKAVGGDLFRIETVKPYAKDYYQCIEEAKQELRAQARPELKDERTELSDYDNIFVLGPCWWGTYPMAMYTQLEKLDFTGKRVFLLMTHEGSGMGQSEGAMKKLMKGARFGRSLAVHGADAAQSEGLVAGWARNCVA